ncbi:MAG: VOC family protein [Mycetocola sp.]
MTPSRIRATYVEIPVADLDRAERFYRIVLHAPTRRTVLDGHAACLLDDAPGGEGAVIALMHGESYVPSTAGTRVYVTVPDVAATLELAVAHGGGVLYPPTTVDDDLIVAEFSDSEGNRVALSSR